VRTNPVKVFIDELLLIGTKLYTWCVEITLRQKARIQVVCTHHQLRLQLWSISPLTLSFDISQFLVFVHDFCIFQLYRQVSYNTVYGLGVVF